jgi:uroporphyrinogen-III synthase
MTVFITRDLTPDSVFLQQLTALGWAVRGQSLLTIATLPFDTPPPADWIFFSSANGVRYFYERLTPTQYRAKTAAIGPATAATLAKIVPKVDFIGDGDPINTALLFGTAAEGQTVLFPGAEQSRQSVQQQLAGRIAGTHWPVYTNAPLANVPSQSDAHVLVFTSPLNVQAYCTQHEIRAAQRCVAIGATTASALLAWGAFCTVSATPTETGLAKAVVF